VAMEEKLRLEKLESERLARMHGKYDGLKPVPKHRSADDLDDGLVCICISSSFFGMKLLQLKD
jgi:hypothetical protein